MTDHEFSPLQHSEQPTGDIPAPLVQYVDEQVARLESRVMEFRKRQKANGRLEDQFTRYQTIQQELSQGTYDALSAELQTEAAEQVGEIDNLRQQLRPQGEMHGDQQFFSLRDQIQEGETILVKAVAAGMDEQSRSWITKAIDGLRHQQYTQTDRGQIRDRMDIANTRLNSITNLRGLIPQSTARPQAVSNPSSGK